MKIRTADAAEPSAASLQTARGPTGALARLSVTKFNAQMGLGCDVVVGLLLIGAGLYTNHYGVLAPLATVALGLFAFSLVEYVFHRWLFHTGRSSMREGHDNHHDDPNGYDALPFFIPPIGMLLIAAALAFVVPATTALLLAGSVATGYAAYGVAHTMIHAFRFRRPTIAKWAANHHIHHHHPGCNFGVTTPLWDIVLGTRYVPTRVRVSASAADE
jgi:sterol desaturase/sphingolipid hydroxylase (fatty acid hydroxylase superfamily)